MTIYINKQTPANEEIPYPCGCVAELKIEFTRDKKENTVIDASGATLAKVEVEFTDFIMCDTHKQETQNKAMKFVKGNVR